MPDRCTRTSWAAGSRYAGTLRGASSAIRISCGSCARCPTGWAGRWRCAGPDPLRVSRVASFIRGDGQRAAVLLINASLDASQPCDLLLRGGMTRARALQADGAQADLPAARERDGLCARLPSIPPWQPLVVLAE